MKKLTLEDIKNIVNLLKDPDKKIFEMLEPKILSEGFEYLSYFKEELKNSSDLILKTRLEIIIEKLVLNGSLDEFRKITLLENEDINLEEACFTLASFANPNLEKEVYLKSLDEMAENLKDKVKNMNDPIMLIKKINQYLFLAEGFKGNREDYFNINNSYIPTVIETKTGIPITISAIYLFVTKRLNLPFYGVGMPGHFIIKYMENDLELFIDPFHGGKILSKTDCVNFLVFSGYGFNERFLEVTSNKEIFKRMIRNILLVYQQNNDTFRYEKFNDILNIIDINY